MSTKKVKGTTNFTVRVPAKEAEALGYLAALSNKSRNDLVVEALQAYLTTAIEERLEFEERLDRLMKEQKETLGLLSR